HEMREPVGPRSGAASARGGGEQARVRGVRMRVLWVGERIARAHQAAPACQEERNAGGHLGSPQQLGRETEDNDPREKRPSSRTAGGEGPARRVLTDSKAVARTNCEQGRG